MVKVASSRNCYGCHPPKWDPATCKCPECNRREAPCFMHGGKTGFGPNPDNLGEHTVDLHRALDEAEGVLRRIANGCADTHTAQQHAAAYFKDPDPPSAGGGA